MYTNSEKIVKYLYQVLGEQNFVEFVEILVSEKLMSEIEFNNFKRIFQKKPEKQKPATDIRKFMNQRKKTDFEGIGGDGLGDVIVGVNPQTKNISNFEGSRDIVGDQGEPFCNNKFSQ